MYPNRDSKQLNRGSKWAKGGLERPLRAIVVALLAASCASCSSSNQIAKAISQDGKAVATISERETHGPPRIPEPPKTTGRWAKLSVSWGNSSYDTGFEKLNIYDHASFATDLAWSRDSQRLAYRRVNELRIFAPGHQPVPIEVVTGNSLIASFKWIETNSLIVVTETVNDPLDMYGKPDTFHGYISRARGIRIVTANMNGKVNERYTQEFSKPAHVDVVDMYGPTFIFRGVGFLMDPISPAGNRIAFGDGENLCIFDNKSGNVISRKEIPNQIEGIWWVNEDTVLLGLDLLSGNQLKFITFDVDSQTITDVSAKLLPAWNRNYYHMNWFQLSLLLK